MPPQEAEAQAADEAEFERLIQLQQDELVAEEEAVAAAAAAAEVEAAAAEAPLYVREAALLAAHPYPPRRIVQVSTHGVQSGGMKQAHARLYHGHILR